MMIGNVFGVGEAVKHRQFGGSNANGSMNEFGLGGRRKDVKGSEKKLNQENVE